MPSKLISFRLSDEAIEALSAYGTPGESVNLIAQKLLLEVLSVYSVDSVDKPASEAFSQLVDRIVNSDQFKDCLDEKLTWLVNSMNGKFAEQEARLEKLESSLVKPKATSKPRRAKQGASNPD